MNRSKVTEAQFKSLVDGNVKKATDFIISKGCAFFLEWKEGYKLLCQLLEKNKRDVAILFIKEGIICQLNEKDCQLAEECPDPPIHLALRIYDMEIFSLLLEKSVDVNSLNKNKVSPLHIAVETDNYEATKILLKLRAKLDYNYTSMFGNCYSILYLAFKRKNERIINLISTRINYKLTKAEANLDFGEETKRLQIMQKLLNYFKNDSNFTYFPDLGDNYSLLYLSVLKNDVEQVKNLLKNEIMSVNMKDKVRRSLLYISYQNRSLEIMEELINRGVYINETFFIDYTQYSYTLLYIALSNDDLEVCNLLLKQYNKIEPQGPKNLTPLHIAIEKGHKDIVKQILCHMCAPQVYESDYNTINNMLKFVKQKKDSKLLKMFEDAKKKQLEYFTNPDNVSFIFHNYSEEMTLQLLNEIWIKEPSSVNALFLVANLYQCTKILKETVKCGANVNLEDENGEPPITIAVYNRSADILHFLLESGANVNSRNRKNQTALHIALQRYEDECVMILLDFEVDIYLKEHKDSKRLVDLLLETYSKEIYEVFLKYIFKRNLAKLPIEKKFYDMALASKSSINITNELSEEITSMKSYMILLSHISFYDFFICLNNIDRLIEFIKKPGVISILEKFTWKSIFPNFYCMIKNAFIKAKKKMLLMEQETSENCVEMPSIDLTTEE